MESVIENNVLTFDVTPYLTDRGWVISSNNSMTHTPPNTGEFEVLSTNIREGGTYEYSFNVTNLESGSLIFMIGGVEAPIVTTNGYFQGQVTALTDEKIKVWADGQVTITGINISEMISEDNSLSTLTWGELRKGWVTFKDLIPESGFSMYTNLFTLKEGNLWIHSELSTPNFIYGKQRYSTVKFPVSSIGVKTYHTIAVHANKVLGTTEEGITTELGNVTDLITYDFDTSSDGVHYANKLRDALLNEKLKGRYIVVELSDEETSTQKLQLFKVVIKGEISSPNE